MVLRMKVDAKKFREELNKKLSRETALEFNAYNRKMLRDLKDATPVDTGEARDGWHINETRFTLPFDLFRGREMRLGIQNSVSHIVFLNYGHSKQAPSNFIESILSRYGRL